MGRNVKMATRAPLLLLLLALPTVCVALHIPVGSPPVTSTFMGKDYWEPPMEPPMEDSARSFLPGLEEFWTDGDEATPTSMMIELSAEDLVSELPAMPCITEECDIEAAAGLADEPLTPELTANLDDMLLENPRALHHDSNALPLEPDYRTLSSVGVPGRNPEYWKATRVLTRLSP